MSKLLKGILTGLAGVAVYVAVDKIGDRYSQKRLRGLKEELEIAIDNSPTLQMMRKCNEEMEKFNEETKNDIEQHRVWLKQFRERNEAQ